MFCRSLFVTLSFFFWPLYCLFFFDLHPPITPLYQFKLFSKQIISHINYITLCICSSGSVNKQIHYENYTENISNAVAIQHVIFLSLLQSICSYQSTLNDFLVDFLIMTENVFHVLIITYSSECNQ